MIRAAVPLSVAWVLWLVAGCGDDTKLSDDGAGNQGGQGGAPCSGEACADGGHTSTGGQTSEQLCRGELLDRGDAAVIEDGRGAEIACDGYTIRAVVHDRGVLRLGYEVLGESAAQRPSYAVVQPPNPELEVAIGANSSTIRVCTDELLVEVDRASCNTRVVDESGAVLSEDPEGGGFVVDVASDTRSLVRKTVADEHFYGFGERTGPLDKRGHRMTFWNTDAYVPEHGGYPPNADALYQSIPFFVGLRNGRAYGVLLDNTHRLVFDMAQSSTDRYQLMAEGGKLEQWIFTGPEIREVASKYAELTGPAPLPPKWALGYHQSRWGYPSQSAVLNIADELRARRLPADSVWLDIQHMDGFRSFTWDPQNFGDPSSLVAELSRRGMHTVAIIDPAIKVDTSWSVFTEMADAGLFLSRDGEPYIGRVWPGDAAFPDFTAPKTRSYWGSLVAGPSDLGIDGLWIDMNEPSDFIGPGGTVPNDLSAAGDGAASTMAELHNVYGLSEARATFEGMRQARPDRRPFVLSRAGYAGIQRYAAVWTGDAPSTWATLQTTLPMLLGMGLSGVPFVGSDVGGYSGGASPELFARWMQLGSVSPFFRAHVVETSQPQEPWQFGTEVEDISRQAASARYELLPTLYSLFAQATSGGAPILRPLVFEFQSDPTVRTIGDQAMLGPHLMIAPVLEQGATSRTVYFPAGRWFEVRSNASYEGPATVQIGTKLGALPMFAREGAIVAKGPPLQYTDEAPLSPLRLDLYPGPVPTAFSLYEDDGQSFEHLQGASASTVYTLQSTQGGALLRAQKAGDYETEPRSLVLRVSRADHGAEVVLLNGEAMEPRADLEDLLASGDGWFWDEADLAVVIAFADPGAFELELVYDAELSAPSPPVPMTFNVKVPDGTPTSMPIHIASSASGWLHQPLDWGPGPNEATGTILVPRGEWVEYKYTRGDWASVEKWPECVEAANRYELGAAHPIKEDRVWMWADQCP